MRVASASASKRIAARVRSMKLRGSQSVRGLRVLASGCCLKYIERTMIGLGGALRRACFWSSCAFREAGQAVGAVAVNAAMLGEMG